MEPLRRVVEVIKSTEGNRRPPAAPVTRILQRIIAVGQMLASAAVRFYFAETSFSNCVSSKVGTPKDFAFSSFDPASSPTTT